MYCTGLAGHNVDTMGYIPDRVYFRILLRRGANASGPNIRLCKYYYATVRNSKQRGWGAKASPEINPARVHVFVSSHFTLSSYIKATFVHVAMSVSKSHRGIAPKVLFIWLSRGLPTPLILNLCPICWHC